MAKRKPCPALGADQVLGPRMDCSLLSFVCMDCVLGPTAAHTCTPAGRARVGLDGDKQSK